MTTTSETKPQNLYVGRGASIHLPENPGSLASLCGANYRLQGGGQGTPTSKPVTCKRCIKTAEKYAPRR